MGMTNPSKLLVLRDRFAVIQTGDSLFLTSLNGKYNSVLPLKSPLDRFLAMARSTTGPCTTEHLVALTASGMLEIMIDVAKAIQGSGQ